MERGGNGEGMRREWRGEWACESAAEWSGVEWSGVEWSGVEWSGGRAYWVAEWSGVEWNGVGGHTGWHKRLERDGGERGACDRFPIKLHTHVVPGRIQEDGRRERERERERERAREGVESARGDASQAWKSCHHAARSRQAAWRCNSLTRRGMCGFALAVRVRAGCAGSRWLCGFGASCVAQHKPCAVLRAQRPSHRPRRVIVCVTRYEPSPRSATTAGASGSISAICQPRARRTGERGGRASEADARARRTRERRGC